jgi:hypothetical protein
MHGWLIVAYLLLWVTLVRALLVRAKVLRLTCARCALPLERRRLGEPICRCRRSR